MTWYSISTESGRVVSIRFRTLKTATKAAYELIVSLGINLQIDEYPTLRSRTGHPVLRIIPVKDKS